MDTLEANLGNREWVLSRLRAEVVGPDPSGECVALVEKQSLTWEELRKPRKQVNGEEILWQDGPTKRYGAGILFPLESTEQTYTNAVENSDAEAPTPADVTEEIDADRDPLSSTNTEKIGPWANEESADDGVTLANAFRPSALGVSFLADLASEKSGLVVELVNVGRIGMSRFEERPSAIYKPLTVSINSDRTKRSSERAIWLRQPILNEAGAFPQISVSTDELLNSSQPIRRGIGPPELELEVLIVARWWSNAPTAQHRLLTISILNRQKPDGRVRFDAQCIFQTGLRIKGQTSELWIDPYPENLVAEFRDSDRLADENVNRVLFRENRTFAIGHGCGADWLDGRPVRVGTVWSDVLPVYETPATSAELLVTDPTGNRVPLKVSMRLLAGLDPANDGLGDIERMLDEYDRWIESLKRKIELLDSDDVPTASALIEKCVECRSRIADGLTLLREESETALKVRHAFRLANLAMLISQRRGKQELRQPVRSEEDALSWSSPIREFDPSVPDAEYGYWRPFQIAFLVMSLRGIFDSTHKDRSVVDLIWFPTGGGKTEAYLGLTAFTIFFNALSKASVSGVDVLMRYTLRLLTAQQFQRAATLFCAMEHLRRKNVESLGERPFRIGLWVGGSATPNRREDALTKLRELQRDVNAENPYVLLRCPWCAARFGPIEGDTSPGGKGHRGASRGTRARASQSVRVYGYVREKTPEGDTVAFRCSDEACEFGGLASQGRPALPIVVIDEDLLASPPNLLIGTVDKFAMLTWSPRARRIFGLNESGRHEGLPPTLIIQDELHLISGPLGSMVGAYETVIEALCVDPFGGVTRPKIVASTATISRAQEQVHHLYARRGVTLFPPSGLQANDSFFAREATNDDGTPKPGRLYVGVLAPAHNSLQTTQARIFASLMQHASLIDGEADRIDPWWTLLVFFNSLRELGGAATLFTADVREYLRVILDRLGLEYTKIRQMLNVEELTSRIRSDHIPRLLEALERPFRTGGSRGSGNVTDEPIDACLASNIIEVGVDIPRLSLMAIVGQPKTTSQYIQVSSRVGRDASRPGLVVVLYGQTKPRDRSHYEKFRSYHQQLYAQVEPTSVTPFSPPAVDRALHGLIVALVRQLGDFAREAQTPDPFPLSPGTALRIRIEEVIRERVSEISPDELAGVLRQMEFRLKEWSAWNPAEYGGFAKRPEHPPLMHPAGTVPRPQWNEHSWATMSSLRNVDAGCEADLTMAYNIVPDHTE
jgi:hypothetical protein